MRRHETTVAVRGPWSLATGRAFWEGFSPSALRATDGDALRTVFRVERDWSRAAVEVVQQGDDARVVVTGDGDLDAAAAQACRFPSERWDRGTEPERAVALEAAVSSPRPSTSTPAAGPTSAAAIP